MNNYKLEPANFAAKLKKSGLLKKKPDSPEPGAKKQKTKVEYIKPSEEWKLSSRQPIPASEMDQFKRKKKKGKSKQ